MQHSRFSEQQIAFVLDQVARGASLEQTCHHAGISVQTYYDWRAKYAGLEPAEIRRLDEIEEERRQLRRQVAGMPAAASSSQGAAQGALSYARAALPAPAPAAALPVPVPAAAAAGWDPRYPGPSAPYPPAPPPRGRVEAPPQARPAPQAARTLPAARPVPQRARPAPSTPWARVLSALRARALLLTCFAGGLAGGFAIGVGPNSSDGEIAGAVPVNMNLLISSYGALNGTMDKGWSGSQSWGRWMEGAQASMLLGFDGPSRGDVEMLLEGRARLAEGQPDHTLIVRYNDAELGRWRLPKGEATLRRRFIVPGQVFNRNTTAQLTFELVEKAPLSPVFGLEAVSLRDARFLRDYKGFVDRCSDGKLSGWAVADGVAVSVAASIGDRPLAATLSNNERPDLLTHGLPADAGFELTFAQPVAPGTAIDVRFADGRPLGNSPCKP